MKSECQAKLNEPGAEEAKAREIGFAPGPSGKKIYTRGSLRDDDARAPRRVARKVGKREVSE